MKKILILGGLGQDGSILSEKMCHNYEIICPIRKGSNFNQLLKTKKYLLPLLDKLNISHINFENFEEINNLIKSQKPDIICNFAAVSNVFNPWENTEEVMRVNSALPAMILETISKNCQETKFIQASSSLVYGRGDIEFCDENTVRNPIFPYGISKNSADLLVQEFRRTGKCPNSSSLIFFNHESRRRGESFFTRKVVQAAIEISSGKKKDKLVLGNIDIIRDMGNATDFMEAVRLIIEDGDPEDYVLGTGEFTLLRDFVRDSFEYFGLDYRDHVIEDQTFRKVDTRPVRANTMKIYKKFGWKSRSFKAKEMIEEILGEY